MKIRKNNKICLNGQQGFTLVELLLVMAIIGILAGVIFMGMNTSRKRAKVTSSLTTANTVLAELSDCYLKNKPISNNPVVGSLVCSGAGNYPGLAEGCGYTSYIGNVLKITCSGGIILCDVLNSKCSVQ